MPSVLIPRRPAPPVHWMEFLTCFLQAPPAIAQELWRVCAPEMPLEVHWVIERCSVAFSMEQARQVARLVTPENLLAAIEQLAPGGTRRQREILRLQAYIRHFTMEDGEWR